ncbi:hypothetical protein [Peptacetobacter sp.]|uniref:hypothetical protein n=1 Tax=Peptacetobacter sp. TaxID=2991975 RepID=UPI00260DBE09|nr:hypothetical protein [Peptacetobacter sp.]
MSKILALANIDFKKNLKFYIFYCISLVTTILALNIFSIYRILTTENILDEYINRIGGVFYGATLLDNNMMISLILFLGIVIAIGYTFVLWIRDFIGRNKEIYTLIMIPENRIKLYFSKILNSMFFIYAVMFSELISLLISKQIFNIFVGSKADIIDTSLNTDFSYISDLKFLNDNIVDFFIDNILLVFMIVCIISLISLFAMNIKHRYITIFILTLVTFIVLIPGINTYDTVLKMYNIFLKLGITDNLKIINMIIESLISIISIVVACIISKRKINI